MNRTRAPRPIPLALTALVAFAGALAALVVAGGPAAHAHGDAPHAAPPATGHSQAPLSRKELAFREGMNKLWEDHITWTRLAIISLTTAAPDTDATVARLLKNQSDIGDAVKPFYGRAAGNTLTAELRKHILIAADLIAAAKASDQAKVAEEQARWRKNADDIAGVLASVNPHFSLGTLKAEMRMHLKLTTDEVVARLAQDWDADVAAYDRVHRHILHMADYLSDGIVEQFPQRFR